MMNLFKTEKNRGIEPSIAEAQEDNLLEQLKECLQKEILVILILQSQ